jgi:2-amino-4-hydroxy-6-hydroxymethyldihydropteridine diphosphokinase
MGANQGRPVAQIEVALAMLARLPRTRLIATSALYRSAPVGDARQPPFVNAVSRLRTTLPPERLLSALLDIERRGGRVRCRDRRSGPRLLDLDLLLYGGRVVGRPGLHVPHPRMHERRFVLLPLCELAPDVEIPGQGPARTLLARLDPLQQPVERLCPAGVTA